MLYKFFNWFTKVTAYPVQYFCFRTKVTYEDKSVQSRRIKGPAIIVSNHTSVYDYAVLLFVFYTRTVRVQMAEVLFKRKMLGPYLRMMGGIYVDRLSHDMTPIYKSQQILDKGGVVGIYPESRLPDKGEPSPLEFKTGAAMLALMTGVKVIPVYTDGHYFKSAPAHVIIGKPIDPTEYGDGKAAVNDLNQALRNKIIDLERLMKQ